MCHCLLQLLFISVGKCNGKVGKTFLEMFPPKFLPSTTSLPFVFPSHGKENSSQRSLINLPRYDEHTQCGGQCNEDDAFHFERNFTLRFLRKLQKLVCAFLQQPKKGWDVSSDIWQNWLKAKGCLHFHFQLSWLLLTFQKIHFVIDSVC